MRFGVSVKNRQEYEDYDYLHKLSPSEYKWLRKFHREYLNADFKHTGPLMRSKKSRRACYDANNARNRDLYSFLRVRHKLMFARSTEGKLTKYRKPDYYEDFLLTFFDNLS
jgi:hypothetical protein